MAKGPVAKSLTEKLQERLNGYILEHNHKIVGRHIAIESPALDSFTEPLAKELARICDNHEQVKLEE